MKKAPVKKKTKKTVAQRAVKKPLPKASAATKATPQKFKNNKPVGLVTHYFAEIKVAIVVFKQPVSVGDEIGFRGATTDFNQKIASMQFDHKPLSVAKKGKEIGIKVSKRVREGDSVFLF